MKIISFNPNPDFLNINLLMHKYDAKLDNHKQHTNTRKLKKKGLTGHKSGLTHENFFDSKFMRILPKPLTRQSSLRSDCRLLPQGERFGLDKISSKINLSLVGEVGKPKRLPPEAPTERRVVAQV